MSFFEDFFISAGQEILFGLLKWIGISIKWLFIKVKNQLAKLKKRIGITKLGFCSLF